MNDFSDPTYQNLVKVVLQRRVDQLKGPFPEKLCSQADLTGLGLSCFVDGSYRHVLNVVLGFNDNRVPYLRVQVRWDEDYVKDFYALPTAPGLQLNREVFGEVVARLVNDIEVQDRAQAAALTDEGLKYDPLLSFLKGEIPQ